MKSFQRNFINLALKSQDGKNGVISFGDFKLKSGRSSPYFFNAGFFNKGALLAEIGDYFAEAIINTNINYDGLFGPAYKGIPLVSATTIALAKSHGISKPWCFNRKVAKNYGEGGNLVGFPVKEGSEWLIVDDVLTAGTAVSESIEILQKNGAKVAGVITLIDRCEKTKNNKSANQYIESNFHIPVLSVITIYHVLEVLQEQKQNQAIAAIEKHLSLYGCKLNPS